MPNKTITLPPKENMLERLRKVESDPYTQENLYSLFTKHAGQQKLAKGVVVLIQTAIAEFAQKMPPITAHILSKRTPEFIDALILDEEAAAEAKTFFGEAVAAVTA